MPFGQTLDAGEWRVPRAWAEVASSANVAERKAEIAQFNSANRWRKRGLAMVPTKYGINFTGEALCIRRRGALIAYMRVPT